MRKHFLVLKCLFILPIVIILLPNSRIREFRQQRWQRQRKHLFKPAYFTTIPSCSHSMLLTKYATNGVIGSVPSKLISIRKDLLLCVHVVVKTLNLEISRCHLADYVKEFY